MIIARLPIVRSRVVRLRIIRLPVARLPVVAAAVTAAWIGFGAGSFAPSSAHAGTYGNAPWCAVTNGGVGDMQWDCEFASAEACQPHVIAGNRGFCNLNPYFVPPAGAAASGRYRKRPS
jgi:hypothetical protein